MEHFKLNSPQASFSTVPKWQLMNMLVLILYFKLVLFLFCLLFKISKLFTIPLDSWYIRLLGFRHYAI